MYKDDLEAAYSRINKLDDDNKALRERIEILKEGLNSKDEDIKKIKIEKWLKIIKGISSLSLRIILIMSLVFIAGYKIVQCRASFSHNEKVALKVCKQKYSGRGFEIESCGDTYCICRVYQMGDNSEWKPTYSKIYLFEIEDWEKNAKRNREKVSSKRK
jgi:hypothetical protein